MTTPADTRPHAAALLATLVAAGLSAYQGEAVGDALPRTVLHVAPGFHDGTLGDRYKDVAVPFQTTSIGTTAEQALWQHDKTVAALLGAAPAVSGRVPFPIFMDAEAQPVQRDDTGSDSLYFATATWVFHTSA